MTSKSDSSDGQLSALALAGILAGVLGIVVVTLNLASSDAARIRPEQFKRLVDEGLVETIEVSGEILRVRLSRTVRLGGEQSSGVPTDRVNVPLTSAPDESRMSAWRARGIEVFTTGADASSGPREMIFAIAVALLLTAGTWYMVARARAERRGGPRQRLLDAEVDFREGRLNAEEYRERVDAISLEL